MSRGGKLVVISGPSGVGKSAVCSELLKLPRFRRVITCTTREPRPGETDAEEYHFLSQREFEEKVGRGEFLEHAAVHGHRYGTLRTEVEKLTTQGHYVLLAIDVQGAERWKSRARASTESDRGHSPGDSSEHLVTIFLVPPTLETLRDRLRKRGTETADQVAARLQTAQRELATKDAFDHIVVNGDLGTAARRILECVEAPESLYREYDRILAIEKTVK